jgi:chaperonin cofactor prefoldin
MAGEKQHWTVNKNVSASHLVTTLLIAISAFTFIMRLETQIELTKQRLDMLEDREARLEESLVENEASIKDEIRSGFSDIKKDMRRIEDKLDQKADK